MSWLLERRRQLYTLLIIQCINIPVRETLYWLESTPESRPGFFYLSSVSPHWGTCFYGVGSSHRELFSFVHPQPVLEHFPLLEPFIFKPIYTGKTTHLTTLSIKHLLKTTHMVYSLAYNVVYTILPKRQSTEHSHLFPPASPLPWPLGRNSISLSTTAGLALKSQFAKLSW